MRSIAAIPAILIVLACASCSKQMDDRVYLRFENISDYVLQNTTIQYYTDNGKAVQFSMGSIPSGRYSSYIGFESISTLDGIPVISAGATVNGAEMTRGAWCGGSGMFSKMSPGHYTIEVRVDEGYLFLQLKK